MQGRDALEILDEAPLTQFAERLVDHVRKAAGTSTALYVADLDGRCLRRVAGDGELPEELETMQLVGPEIPESRAGDLERAIQGTGEVAAILPLWLRGRAVGLLAFGQPPSRGVDLLATYAAAAVELADRYTDVFARARRQVECSAAAELQQELLPPRIGRFEGADVAGSIVPAYDIGGDWIDHCVMPGGGWLGVADAVGKGAQAGAIGALALGAYRAARRGDSCTLAQAAGHIHRALGALEIEEIFVSAVLASWDGPSSTLTWLRCGHPPPMVWHRERGLRALEGGDGPVLGLERLDPPRQSASRTIATDEIVVMVSDGILEHSAPGREPFGEDGLGRALDAMHEPSATAALTAVLDAVRDVHSGGTRDDASIVVLAPTGERIPG